MRLQPLLNTAMVAAFSPLIWAVDLTDCDKVADKVRSSVEVEPAKVLLIVEDAMVTNEACACEIVKAAILASHATDDLVNQIKLTATNVAPNRASLIAECASAILASRAGGKEVKQVIAVQPEMKADPDYKVAPADIRGIYLIQPAAGGIVIKKEELPPPKDPPRNPPPPKRPPPPRTPPPQLNPLSPSVAQPS